jgi:hypothetical protein
VGYLDDERKSILEIIETDMKMSPSPLLKKLLELKIFSE